MKLSRIHHGAVIMAVSATLFAVMGAFVKYASKAGATNAEITFARFFTGLLTVLILWRTGHAKIRTKRPVLVAARGIVGSIAILFFFFSIGHTTLSKASLLSYSWIIFAPILSIFVLREKIGPLIAGLLAVSVMGIWLICDPGHTGGVSFGELAGVISAILSSVAIIIIRELRKTDGAFTIFFSLSLVGTVFSVIVMLADPAPDIHHPLLFLFIVGLTSTVAQLMMTYAYRWCTTAEGAVISMLSPAFGVVLGAILFRDDITIRTILGGALVLGCGSYLALRRVEPAANATHACPEPGGC